MKKDEPEEDMLRVFQTREESRLFYNKLAGVYDHLAEKSEQPMRDLGLELLQVKPGEHLLEIGFGTGHSLAHLSAQAGTEGRVYGVDLSEGMLHQALKNLEEVRSPARVELLVGDAVDLPLDDQSLDAIFMSFTLELFDTPEIPKVLGECRRVLKPGGRLSNVSLSKGTEPGVMVHAFEWTHRHFPNLMDCRPIYGTRCLQEAGFEIRAVRHEKMWVPVEIVLAGKPSG